MNTILDFISKCNEKGIDFKINNEELLIEAKKGVLTDDIIFKLKQNKQEIIFLLKKKYAKLSFAQERLWFMDQYEHNAS
ncbi:MAG: hypothetical protein HXX16_20670, partial [Bacteroidales bacterium]|nr:hypothetical protein [Bacteroidales bacterium]